MSPFLMYNAHAPANQIMHSRIHAVAYHISRNLLVLRPSVSFVSEIHPPHRAPAQVKEVKL